MPGALSVGSQIRPFVRHSPSDAIRMARQIPAQEAPLFPVKASPLLVTTPQLVRIDSLFRNISSR